MIPFGGFKSRLPPRGTEFRIDVQKTQKANHVNDEVNKDGKFLQRKKKYSRKSFSPELGGYEMDIMFAGRAQYLVIININTKFLHVFPIFDKTWATIYKILEHFIPAFHVTSLRGDDESAFTTLLLQRLYARYGVKIVDSVIRTIRDLFGANDKNIEDNVKMQEVVDYLNNSTNRSTKFTPSEMETYPDLERSWIRHNQEINDGVVAKQRADGLWDYVRGDILLVYVAHKTSEVFKKKRGLFNSLGEFRQYVNGNVELELITSNKIVVVPIYFTKFCAKNIDSIPYEIARKIFG
jgi:hypothetical protein